MDQDVHMDVGGHGHGNRLEAQYVDSVSSRARMAMYG